MNLCNAADARSGITLSSSFHNPLINDFDDTPN